MNKKVLTILVIVATIISVVLILYPFETDRVVEESVQVKNDINKSKEDTKNKIDKEKSLKIDTEEIKAQESNEDDEAIVAIEDNDHNINDDSYEDNEEIDQDQEDALTASMIFKVDKNSIDNKISVANKAKLLYYASKLSNFDYATIKDILDNGDEVEGTKDIIKILKSRLKEEDYNEVKKILSPYINVDKVEEYISV